MPNHSILLQYCDILKRIILMSYISLLLHSELVHVFCYLGGNYRGSFALGLVQGEWKLYVKWPLDREEHNLYTINVTASDGLFVCHTVVQVTVVDTNDNSPVCDKAST